MQFSKDYKKIKGDASFRKFYKNKKTKSILVYAKKEKDKNLLIYDAINKILIKNGVIAPKLLRQNYKKNYIEIEDLGDKTIYQSFLNKEKNHYLIFKKVIKILNKIQTIKNKKIKNFNNRLHKVKYYEKNILFDEVKLFSDWYVNKKLTKKKLSIFKYRFNKEIKFLLSRLNYKNDTFVHRDFHVSNLMVVNNRIGLIDSQDALIGNRAYDLASLIDDVRLKTSKSFKKKIFNLYIKKQKKLDKEKFKNDFEILSILRNLKIIGIFSRLAIRDGKKNYLKMIPYTWELIRMRINENEIFNDLKNLLIQNFKKKLNEN